MRWVSPLTPKDCDLPLMLPQEIVDFVIDQLEDTPATLKSCSLVSRRWTARSQKHLFERVVIRSDYLRRWCQLIKPGTTGLSPHTSHLVLVAAANPSKEDPWFEPNLLRHASDHLSSFTNVHTLDVIRWKFSGEELYTTSFTQIASTIRSLKISSPVLDSSVFLEFITFFHRAVSISIIHPQITAEEFATPNLLLTLSTTLCWTSLRLLDFSDKGLPLLDWIAQLPLRLINLSVGLQSQSYHSSSLTLLLRASSASLQALQLCRSAGGELVQALVNSSTGWLTSDQRSIVCSFYSPSFIATSPPPTALYSILRFTRCRVATRGDPPDNNVQVYLQDHYRNAASVGPSYYWVRN